MNPAPGSVFCEPQLAAMPQLSEKPRQGFETWKQAWKPSPNVANSTVAIGLRAGLVLEGVRKTYRARYYNPATGRFLSEDPLGFGGGTVNFYQYAMDNPMGFRDPTGLLNVYTWPATLTGNVGHAAILLDDGTYISFWPGTGAPAFVPTLQTDQAAEGSTPEITNIEGLDEAAMENWWNEFKQTNNWDLVRPNCSTAAAHALDAGGGRNYVPFGQDYNYFWTPQDVAQYANDISFGLSNPSVLQQVIHYLPRMF